MNVNCTWSAWMKSKVKYEMKSKSHVRCTIENINLKEVCNINENASRMWDVQVNMKCKICLLNESAYECKRMCIPMFHVFEKKCERSNDWFYEKSYI